MIRTILTLACFLPAIAAADPSSETTTTASPNYAPVAPHVNGGLELMGGGGAFSAGFRGHLGLDKSIGVERMQPMFGIGVTFGAGVLSVSDPRGLDGSVTLGHMDFGPEAQVGVRWVNGGLVDTRLFASFAYLHTRLDHRLMLDAVHGVEGTTGMRATIGFNWADRIFSGSHEHHGGKDIDLGWLAVFAPQQIEIGWERSAGSDRGGVTLGWGI